MILMMADFSCNAEIQLLLVTMHMTFMYILAFIRLLKILELFGC